MGNVKQMLTVLEQGSPDVSSSVRTLARMTFQTGSAGVGFTTRITAMFVGDFSGPSGISRLEFILDDELIEPTLDTTTTLDSETTLDPQNPARRSVTYVAFRTGVPSGTHELTVRHRRARPPEAMIGPRTLTI